MEKIAHRYGLIGKKLGHSFSKNYFNSKFDREDLPAYYESYELPEIAAFAELVKTPLLRGLNVTIPYKQDVIPFLDELSPEAEAIGAVNTIKLEDGKLKGFNTDIYGFWLSLKNLVQEQAVPAALVLGTGGASKAVVYVLEHMLKVEEIKLVSRRPSGENQISYEALGELDMDRYRLIINTTPLGMYPEIERYPSIPYERLSAAHMAMDLIYNPDTTAFMKQAQAYGAQTRNGLEMLIGQAEKAWAIWQGDTNSLTELPS